MYLKQLDKRIAEAVTPFVPELAPGRYTGNADEYCTWNAEELPEAFGDGRAKRVRYLVQVHWFLPLKRRPYDKKTALRRALMNTPGFTAPTIVPDVDGDGQHYIFEFEALGGRY